MDICTMIGQKCHHILMAFTAEIIWERKIDKKKFIIEPAGM
jgi:hypothetical protein